MKSAFLVLVLLAVPVFAQERTPTRRVVAPAMSGRVQSDVPALKENITIRLFGTQSGGGKVDLSVTGAGPSFYLRKPIGPEGDNFYLNYTVRQADSGYLISYEIGARIRVVVSQNAEAKRYEFTDMGASGTVLCRPGAPVIILSDGGAPLTLLVTEPGA